ncbi:MAG: DUF4912 domain-containing protein [Planctomycetota bacterium]
MSKRKDSNAVKTTPKIIANNQSQTKAVRVTAPKKQTGPKLLKVNANLERNMLRPAKRRMAVTDNTPAIKTIRRIHAPKIATHKPRLRAPIVEVSSKTHLPQFNSMPVSSRPMPSTHPPLIHSESMPSSTPVDRGLPIPETYGLDRLVAMARDPQWIFCYWELQGAILSKLRQQRGQSFISTCAWTLRLYRLDENSTIDNKIQPATSSWYIQVGGPGRYQIELALLSPDGEWISLVVSQVVETPAIEASQVFDEQWRMRPEDERAMADLMRDMLKGFESVNVGYLSASRLKI